MKYKAVIFDLFGTLVDNFSNSEYDEVLEDMAAVLKTPFTEFSRLWRESFTIRVIGAHKTESESIQYICDTMGVPVTPGQVMEASDIRLYYSMRTIVPRPATLPTISELKKRGYKVGLISDCSPEAPQSWANTQFADVFHVTVFSCSVGMKKPDPRIYLLACEQLGVEPEDCVYVGDGGSNELTGAAGVGMYPVLIHDAGENEDTHFVDREEGWSGPVIATLDELLELLD